MPIPSSRRLVRVLALLVYAGGLALAAGAQTTWVVDLTNPNPPGNGTPGNPYTSIQFAIAQPTTLDGDTVSVHPGVYFESLDLLGKRLIVASTDGRDVTIVDAGGNGSVVSAKSGEPRGTRIEGFTLRGGSGTPDAISGEARGGAVYCQQSSLQVMDCILRDNATVPPGGGAVDGTGGGVYAFGAGFFSLFDCVIESNRANRGGGGWIEQSTALVFVTAIQDNRAVAVDLNHAGHGGGLGVVDSVLNFDLCTVERNEAEAGQFVPARGGGLLVWGGSGSVLNSLFADNVAGTASTTQFVGQGGGLEVMFLDSPQDMQVGGCELRDNLALNGGGFLGMGDLAINEIHDNLGQNGAGVYSMGIDMRQTEVYDNRPLVPDENSSGLGIFTDPTATSSVINSTIRNHDGQGIGIGVWGGDFTQCQIRENRAVGTQPSSGGGAFGATLTRCWLTRNEAHQVGSPNPASEGGAMSSCNATRCVMWLNSADRGGGAYASSLLHCTVTLNTATNGSSAGGVLDGGTLNSCIVWDNHPVDVLGAASEFSDIGTGFTAGLGNISADPEFWQPLNDDFLLRPTSPCIDSGDPTNTADPDGSRADMGALAFYPPHFAPPFVYCTPKVNSQNCTPSLFTTGAPTVSAGGPLMVHADNVINQQNGILFWGSTPAAQPIQGGLLCVGPPVTRTAVQSSGGNTGTVDCSGSYSFQWTSSYLQSQGLQPGDRVFAQFWSRDPGASFGSGLTAGVDITFIP